MVKERKKPLEYAELLEHCRTEIKRLHKRLDDREEDLIEAKREERERITELLDLHENEIGFCEISNHVSWKALKGE